MKYRSFEEVPVWRDALELAILIFELTSQAASKATIASRINWNEPVFRSQTTLLKDLNAAQPRKL